MKKHFLIVGNWKMHPRNPKETSAFFRHFSEKHLAKIPADVVIAPPFPFLSLFPRYRRIMLGAQDVFWEPEGSFTGEVSGTMLKSVGVRYVIVGHSERRHLGETDEAISKKLKHALKAGLRPILCVGEERRDHDGAFFGIIKHNLRDALTKLKKDEMGRVAVAYEPIWAIGSGRPAKPKDANEAALFIKKTIAELSSAAIARRVRVLYGGSVDFRNAGDFLREREISGLLVGRESRYPERFLKIIQCARRVL